MVEKSVILSVVIVTYRSETEIRDCLATIPRVILESEVEIIVIDNASGDGVGEIISKEFNDVVFVGLDENMGFGRANNLAYEKASGEYVLFLNPDTVSNLIAYEHCLRALKSDRSIGIISPRLVMANGEMDLACRRSIPSVWDGFCRAIGLAARFPDFKLFSGYNLTYLSDNGVYDVGSVNGAFMLCPRKALLRVGVFDEQFFMYGDDLDLNYRFRKAGYRIVYDGRVSIVHLKGMSSSREPEKMARAVFSATKQFYLKHFNPHDSVWVRWKYELLFCLWEKLASLKAKLSGYKRARPL